LALEIGEVLKTTKVEGVTASFDEDAEDDGEGVIEKLQESNRKVITSNRKDAPDD